jgi:hypothetical protein
MSSYVYEFCQTCGAVIRLTITRVDENANGTTKAYGVHVQHKDQDCCEQQVKVIMENMHERVRELFE